MRPLIGLLLTLGVGSAATATTVVLRDEQTLSVDHEPQRPGPDSARVASLLASLSNADPVTCEMVADQIGNFWWSDGGVGVGQFNDTRASARLGKDSVSGSVTDARTIRLLSATLTHDDPCVRLVAAKMLGNSMADDATIVALLGSQSARVREAALRAAGERGRPALRARVERLLGDEPSVAAMAAWALGEFELRESVPVLRRALTHDAARVRTAAAWALGQVEDPAAAEDLERLVARDSDRKVRLAAVRALGDIEATRSAPVLERVVDGSDVDLAIAAAQALAQLDLGDGPAPAALVRAVGSTSTELRYAALRALFEYEDEALIPVFMRFVRDTDPDIRMQAIQSLGSLGAVAAIPVITRALEDPHPEVRRAAVEALAEIEDR